MSLKSKNCHAHVSILIGWWVFLWICFLGHPLLAQVKPTRDYTRGFEKFLQLGLPDVKNATYVNLKELIDRCEPMDGDSFDHYLQGLGLSGNAWLLSSSPNGQGTFLKTDGATVKVNDREISENEENSKGTVWPEIVGFLTGARASIEENQPSRGTWKPADLDKDIKNLLAFLQKPKDGKTPDRYGLENGGWGKIFLIAAHFSRKGYVKESGQIVELLFQDAGDSRIVIQQALNRLADKQYSEAYREFCLSADWGRFDKALDGVLTRFPSHWKTRPAVQRLSEKVKERLKTKEPPPLIGEELNAEDQKLAREVALANGKKTGRNVMQDGLWILGKSPFSRSDDDSPLARIRALKIRAFPLLLAMLKDTYLTALPPSSNNYSYQSYRSSAQEVEPTEEEIQAMYDQLRRPATRGELARKLLESVIFGQEERFSIRNKDDDEIYRLSRAWYKKYKGKTDTEILQEFLGDTDSSRRTAALQILLDSSRDDDARILEKYFLDSKDASMDFGYITQFVMKRSGKAGDFLEKYLAHVKANPALLQSRASFPDEESSKYMKEETARMLASLESLSSQKPAQGIIDEILASQKKWTPREWQSESSKLTQRLTMEDPQKNLAPLLEAALKTKDSFLACQFLTLVSQLPWMKGFSRMRESSIDESSQEKLDVKPTSDLWKKLLADKRPLTRTPEEGMDEEGDEEGMTLGQFAARVYENLLERGEHFSPGDPRDVAILGNRIFSIYVARAEARLAGKTEDQLPLYPSRKNVTMERRAKIKADLMAADATSLTKLLGSLSLDDLLVLPKIVGEDEKLGNLLKPLAGLVAVTKVKIDDADLRKQVENLGGKPFDKKIAETLLEISRNLAMKGVPSKIVAKRGPLLDGVRISFLENPPIGENDLVRSMGLGNKARITGMVRATAGDNEHAASGFWRVEVPESVLRGIATEDKKTSASNGGGKTGEDLLVQNAGESLMESQLEKQWTEFWAIVDVIFKPEFGPCDSFNVSFRSSLPSVK